VVLALLVQRPPRPPVTSCIRTSAAVLGTKQRERVTAAMPESVAIVLWRAVGD
jgi:hypothetical protein